MRYDWVAHAGGILLIDRETITTQYIQPGDDTSAFLDEIERTNDKYTDDDVIDNYFPN